MSGLSFRQIENMCGTSVAQIEKTYYHLNDEIRLTNAVADYRSNEAVTIEVFLMKKGYRLTAYVFLAFWAGYEAHSNKVFPIGRFIERTFFAEQAAVTEAEIETQKSVYVFTDTAVKKEVECPKEEMAYVLIGFGQSNSANYAGHRSKATRTNR